MEALSLKQMSIEEKIILLKELGYQTDGKLVLNAQGEQLKDKYLDIAIQIDRMLILPGSTIILDDNEFSVTRYFQEYGDKF